MIIPRIHRDTGKPGEKGRRPGAELSAPAEKPLNMKTITWGNLTWVDIWPPTARETQYLAEQYHFHPLDLDDILSKRQLPKIDEYKDYLFWVFHFPVYDVKRKVALHRQLTAFIGNGYLITLHTGELWSIKDIFANCERDEEIRKEYFAHGSGYLLFQIVDKAVDHYFPILDKIMGMIEDLEDSVFNENVEAAQELFLMRRNILFQRRIILPMRTIFQDLFNKIRRFIDIDMSVYFGDVIDHMNKICDTLDEAKEIIDVYKDTDFLMSNYRLNRLVRAVTLLSAFISPALVISGIYGMNVVLPGGMESGNYDTLLLLLIITIIVIAALLFIFKRKRLI
ncbi:MAG: magnesium transporter CorA family protein [Dehalococcoidales bacterium]|nr:magnesium transporter CorA family protein [Dehalococcoidales bacterium]